LARLRSVSFPSSPRSDVSALPLRDALPILRDGRQGAARHYDSRLPGLLVLLAKPDARVGETLSGRGGRPSRLQRPESVSPTRASDRKSTRLNSSHGSISYAVFCLNKKKRTK